MTARRGTRYVLTYAEPSLHWRIRLIFNSISARASPGVARLLWKQVMYSVLWVVTGKHEFLCQACYPLGLTRLEYTFTPDHFCWYLPRTIGSSLGYFAFHTLFEKIHGLRDGNRAAL